MRRTPAIVTGTYGTLTIQYDGTYSYAVRPRAPRPCNAWFPATR